MTHQKTTTVTTVVNGNQTIQKTVVSGDATDKPNYFSENFFKTIAVALTGLGLLGIYVYHYYVEYYPVFDIKSAASLIFAAAYTGFILMALLSVTVCGPWLMVSMLIYDRIKGASKKNISKILVPYGFVAYFSFLLIACEIGFNAGGWVVGTGGVALLIIMYRFIGKNPWPGSHVAEQGGSFLFMAFLQFLPIFLFITFLSQSDPNTPTGALAMFEFLGTIALLNILIQSSGAYVVMAWLTRTLKPRDKTLSVLSVGIVVIFVTVLSKQSDFLGARIANITKFGNFYAAEMTLSKDGCKAINSDGDTVCTGSEEKGFKVCGVYIVSRIGTESYLRIFNDALALPAPSEGIKKSEWFTKAAYLPTKDVLGMRVHEEQGQKADRQFIEKLSACRKKSQQTSSTIIPLGGKEFFELNKAELGATGKLMLAALAEQLLARKDTQWTAKVYGYSDLLGKPAYNENLSRKRAEVVADFLKHRLPAAAQNISSKGEGSAKPRKSEAQCPLTLKTQARIDCLAENRRAEIEIVTTAPGK